MTALAAVEGVVASPYSADTLWYAWDSSVPSFPSQEAATTALHAFLKTVRSSKGKTGQ